MVQMYEAKRIHEDGTEETYAYAYGEDWVAEALYMDDIRFKTPEEAKAWWEKNYGEEKAGR